MRALACLAIAAALGSGCGSATTDPCKGVAGTCVALTVQSSTVTAVDSLHILASGALSGDQTSAGGRANLPIVVALLLPADAAGSLALHVDGVLTGMIVGSCDTDTLVTPGQHATAVCTLVGPDNGGVDMATGGGGDDLSGTGPDMATLPCDPKGMTGPQCVWRWQTPLPQGDDLVGAFAFSDSDIWAVNPSGLLIHRNATGWSYTTPPKAFTQPFFARGLAGGGPGMLGHLFVVGTSGGSAQTQFLYHTSDGINWTSETITSPPSGTTLYGVASSASGLYAMAGGTDYPTASDGLVYVRANGGGSWSRATTPASNVRVTAVALSDTNAVAVGEANGAVAGTIWISSNGGGNWGAFTAATLAPAAPLNGACTGSGTFIVVGNSGTIAATKNINLAGGGFAAATTSGTSAGLQGCAVVNANEAWAFGQNGALVHTTDGGANWSAKSSGVSTALLAGAQSPAAALTIVGGTGTILRTTDSGTTITAEDHGLRPSAVGIWGTSPGVVYVVGAGGSIVRTTDDGKTWAAVASSGTTATLISAWGSSANDVYAGGQMGTLVHAVDGTNFTQISSVNLPTTVSVIQVSGESAGDVFVTTVDSSFNAKLLQSTDNGASWNVVTVTGMAATTNYMSLLVKPGHLWVQSQNQAVFHGIIAANKTITWNAQPVRSMGTPITDSLNSFTGNGTDFYAITSNDAFVHATSATSGTTGTWDFENQSPMGSWGDPITFVRLTPSGSTLFMTGPSCGLITSTNPGGSVTWSPVYTGLASVNNGGDILPLADNDIFLVADHGILHYGN